MWDASAFVCEPCLSVSVVVPCACVCAVVLASGFLVPESREHKKIEKPICSLIPFSAANVSETGMLSMLAPKNLVKPKWKGICLLKKCDAW